VRLTDFDALSFDCYGTLIDWEAGIAAVLSRWARSRQLSLDEEALLAAFSQHEATVEAGHPQDLYPAILARSMRGLGSELGAEVSEQDARALARSVPGWPAFPDSRDALSALGKRYKLIILSNVDRESFAGSNRRLGVRFTSILTTQDIGSYKPSPRNFEALAAEASRLGIPRGRLLHVAQSLFHDHVPAKKAGLPTAWINRRHDRPGWAPHQHPRHSSSRTGTSHSMAAFADAVAAESDRPA
jgi:2-haloacid dehalogenase